MWCCWIFPAIIRLQPSGRDRRAPNIGLRDDNRIDPAFPIPVAKLFCCDLPRAFGSARRAYVAFAARTARFASTLKCEPNRVEKTRVNSAPK